MKRNKPEVLGFIPARGGSKRLPKKNIEPLFGQPLIAYTIDAALASGVTRTLVSTDSEEIAEISKGLGADVPFLRPAHLAGGKSIIEDAIFDALGQLKAMENYTPDVIVLLQPTSPLRKARHIDESVQLLLSTGAESVVSVSDPMEHPVCMVRWDSNRRMHFALGEGLVPGKVQHQDFPEYFFINGAVYCFTVASLMLHRSRFCGNPVPYVMERIYSIDVDTKDEFQIAEAIIKYLSS